MCCKDWRRDKQRLGRRGIADEFSFQRIRHYGFLGNRYRKAELSLCRQLLGVAMAVFPEREDKPDYRDLFERLTGKSLRDCPVCHQGHMVRVAILPALGSGTTARQHSMRRLASNPLKSLPAWLLQAHRRTVSPDAMTAPVISLPVPRPPLPSLPLFKNPGTTAGARTFLSSCADLPHSSTPLSISHRVFITHSPAPGPRFSPIDF